MNREEIREKTMQLIYQMDMTGNFDYTQAHPVDENTKIMTKKQAVDTLEAVRDHIGEIDDVIRACLDRWSFERVARTDLAILRTAVAEMMYVDSVPNSVSINEAVRMAKRFCEEKSYGFVNSVLSKVNKYLSDADRNGEED